MTDIVQRLRAARDDHDMAAAWSYADEAADEIERLRAAGEVTYAAGYGAGYEVGHEAGLEHRREIEDEQPPATPEESPC